MDPGPPELTLVGEAHCLFKKGPVSTSREQEKSHPYKKQWASRWLHHLRGHQTTEAEQSSLGATEPQAASYGNIKISHGQP